MLQARIVSTRGSMYFASEVTPYDLENLRTHVRDFQTTMPTGVRLEVSLDRGRSSRVTEMQVSAWLRRLAADGVLVSLCSAAALDRVAGYTPLRKQPHR
jgi:hypothetical protein